MKEALPMVRRVKIHDVFNVRRVGKCDLLLKVHSDWPTLGKITSCKYIKVLRSNCYPLVDVG